MKLICYASLLILLATASCGGNQDAENKKNTANKNETKSTAEIDKASYEKIYLDNKEEVTRRFNIIKDARKTVVSEPQILEYNCTMELPAKPEQYKEITGMYLMGSNFEDLSQPFDNPYRQSHRHNHITIAELYKIVFTEKSDSFTYETDEFHTSQCFDFGELCFKIEKIEELTNDFLAHNNLFVIRVHEVVKPEMHEDGNFEVGYIVADLMVFSFDSGEYLGGFPFVALSSEKINFSKSPSKQSQIEKDLIKNIPFAIEAIWFGAINGKKFTL